MTIIDSHCHLDFPDFAEDLDGVVERARAAGVGLSSLRRSGAGEVRTWAGAE